MKKIFVAFIACSVLFSCFGTDSKPATTNTEKDYSSDYYWTEYDEISQYNDSINVWYFEPITIGTQKNGLIHSSFDCHTIKNGVILNAYTQEKLNHSFCTKCMTKDKIDEWGKWYDKGNPTVAELLSRLETDQELD